MVTRPVPHLPLPGVAINLDLSYYLLVMNKTEKVALKKHRAKKKKLEAKRKAENAVAKK